MFVAVPTRARTLFRWATPLLAALLWLAYVAAAMRPDAVRHDLVLEWGALSGGLAPPDLWRTWAESERWLRLLTALFLHADWTHLLGNLVLSLIHI